MARPYRTTSPAVTQETAVALVDDLPDNGSRYAFFQAMRLLRQRFPDDQALRDHVRVRPALSLAFPDADIERIQLDESGRYHIEATFFGLYGVTSPLPIFYTEDLIQESMEGYSAMRDFMDIIHASLYPLLYRAWEKYRMWLVVGEQNNTQRLQQLYAAIGIADAPQWDDDARAMLPFAGNLSVFPRSALGLQGLLQGLLRGAAVRVDPCITRAVTIPENARTQLGLRASVLGEDTLLGEQVHDCAGNVDIVIGPLPASDFHDLLPGTALHDRIRRVVAWYLPTPLRCELHLWLDAHMRRTARLGQGWHSLGRNTWLGNRHIPALKQHPVRFPLPMTLETRPS